MQTEGIAGLSPLTPGFSKDLGGKLTFAAKVKDFKVKSESLIWNISPIQIVAISISTIMCVCVLILGCTNQIALRARFIYFFLTQEGGTAIQWLPGRGANHKMATRPPEAVVRLLITTFWLHCESENNNRPTEQNRRKTYYVHLGLSNMVNTTSIIRCQAVVVIFLCITCDVPSPPRTKDVGGPHDHVRCSLGRHVVHPSDLACF